MGCFNVACSISKISINHGDPIVFVPLLHKSYDYYSRRGVLRAYVKEEMGGYTRSLSCYADRMLIYPNALYNPMTFPIKGEYDDYGSIENVERDANVEAIEAFFKLPIEQLVGYDTRDYPLNRHASMFSNYSIEFDDKLIKQLGFEGEEKSFFFFNEEGFEDADKWMVVLKPNEHQSEHKRAEISYDIVEIRETDVIVHKGRSGHSGHDILQSFCSQWELLTGWQLGVAAENQRLIDIFKFMGGMFFHRDVYEAMMKEGPGKSLNSGTLATAELSQYTTEKLGFELVEDLKNSHGEVRMRHKDLPGWYFDVSGRYYSKVFKVDEKTKLEKDRDKVKKLKDLSVCGALALKKALKQHANYDLNIDVLYKETSAGREFDVIRDKLKKYETKDKDISKLMKKLKKTKDGDPKKQDLYDLLSDSHLLSYTHPLRSEYSDSGFDCRAWPFFRDIYEKAFKSGKIKKDWIEWNTFMPSAYSANVHWAPAMNGEQHGNTEESIKLHKAALTVLEERTAKYKEENVDEDEDVDPSQTWYS